MFTLSIMIDVLKPYRTIAERKAEKCVNSLINGRGNNNLSHRTPNGI